MIKLIIVVDKGTGKTEATMEGVSQGKEELYILMGLMEDMKAKLTAAIRDDGASFFAIEKKKVN
jgi:hypothetical protein